MTAPTPDRITALHREANFLPSDPAAPESVPVLSVAGITTACCQG